jgi:SAM-dependent methyltransferase
LPFPGTQSIDTTDVPLADDYVDMVFLILSAHEIRRDEERIAFFRELNRSLKRGGRILVAEHLRDLPNFLAYTIGYFHFHPRATWLETFRAAGLQIARERKLNPFITTFFLEKHGAAA